MLKKLLQNQKLWKRGYRVLTISTVVVALFLIILEGEMTGVQGREKEAIPIPQRRTAGKPNTEVGEEIHRLEGKKQKATKAVYGQTISKKEYGILLRIVEAETTGQDVKSKQIVANVILNRVKSKQFPDTIEQVVFQRSRSCTQFSPIADGRYYSVVITKETRQGVKQALLGQDDSKGALYFANRKYSTEENMRWFDNNLEYLFSYGGHEFFKEYN